MSYYLMLLSNCMSNFGPTTAVLLRNGVVRELILNTPKYNCVLYFNIVLLYHLSFILR